MPSFTHPLSLSLPHSLPLFLTNSPILTPSLSLKRCSYQGSCQLLLPAFSGQILKADGSARVRSSWEVVTVRLAPPLFCDVISQVSLDWRSVVGGERRALAIGSALSCCSAGATAAGQSVPIKVLPFPSAFRIWPEKADRKSWREPGGNSA